MAKIATLHHNINLTTGIMDKIGQAAAWGNNALQTVAISRQTPFNPQQAIGYKGIVDYTSSPVTSTVTLDCILTENTVAASEDTGVYLHGDTEVVIGEESYALTSCALNFQAGNPATVNYAYITAGLASYFDETFNPAVLTAGEEAQFAIVMGEDGKGIKIVAVGGEALAGIQTLGFNSSINRNQILDVRSSSPVQFITTYPLDLSVNLESLQQLEDFTELKVETIGGTASVEHATGFSTTPSGNRAGSIGGAGAGGILVQATGLMKTEESDNMAVGGNLTHSYQYTAADMWIPLAVPTQDAGGDDPQET